MGFLQFFVSVVYVIYGSENSILRIAVIGAGASGLTAAYTLKTLGYSNVTVFEKEAQVGGKVESFYYQGRPYELGAVVSLKDYKTVFSLAEQMGVALKKEPVSTRIVDPDQNELVPERFLLSRFGLPRSAYAYGLFRWILKKFQLPSDGGYAGAHPELFLPMHQFAQKYGIWPLTETFKPYLVGCGYGYFETVPALYYLKLIRSLMEQGAFHPRHLLFPEEKSIFDFVEGGYQELWKKTAASLSVKLSQKINSIYRTEKDRSGIVIEVQGERLVFDKLVWAIPTEQLAAFDLISEKEKNLLSNVKHYQYRVTLFKGDKIGETHSLAFYDRANRRQQGKIVALIGRYPGDNVWLSYQLAEDADVPFERILYEDLKQMNRNVSEVLTMRTWRYFPFVEEQVLRSGFYSELESMQGRFNTYYVGGLFNFESVESSAAYAQNLMQTHFGVSCSRHLTTSN